MFFDFIILHFFNNLDLCDEFGLPDYTVVRKRGVYHNFITQWSVTTFVVLALLRIIIIFVKTFFT